MQLDDVVETTFHDEQRFEEARHRTVRWLDRCIKANKRPKDQNLFPIVQGGLDVEKRRDCARQLVARDTPGFAIGGLSGGEAKDDFWRMVDVSTDELPDSKPRYLMGVGYAVDLVVCSALGVDMFDCVSPTRTARFGTALIRKHPGRLELKANKKFRMDFGPIEEDCECRTCQTVTRSYINSLIATQESSGCHLISVHNVHFQLKLMKELRESIKLDKFPEFVKTFFKDNFLSQNDYPDWAVDALKKVDILLKDQSK